MLKKNNKNNPLIIIISVVVVIIASLCVSTLLYWFGMPDLRDSVYNGDNLAYQLALINSHGNVTETIPNVERFEFLLDSIDKKTSNSREEIADLSVFVYQKYIDKEFWDFTLLAFMETVNKKLNTPGYNDTVMDYAVELSYYID